MEKLLVTGCSGLLGGHLVRAGAGEFEVCGTFNGNPVSFDGVETVQCDLTDHPPARLREFDPDFVVHCAALTDVDECERDPEKARRLNREMTANVTRLADEVDARLVHISTDAVFDGQTGDRSESDDPSPINVYGETKLDAEQIVTQGRDDSVVVRTSFFGWNTREESSGLVEWMLHRLRAEEDLPGLADVYFTPLYAGDLATLLFDLLETEYRGVLHLGASERIDKYVFGERVADTFGYDPDDVRPITLGDLDFDADRGRDLSLDTSTARQVLDRQMPSVERGLERMREDRTQ